jgi:hypothetical protein
MEVDMTASQLPERPNLEQLKRQAKDLLRSAQANDSTALQRFRILADFSDADLARSTLALHDAQSVIAREYGFDSWKALRERVEELTLEFGAAVNQFVEAATDGRADRAERLLALYPPIARANFHTALLLGDAAIVEIHLSEHPELATAAGGPRGWEPLHYVCYSSVGARSEGREAGLVAIARRLISLGADPNLRFPWLHHAVQRPVLWGSVSVVRSLRLAAALLEAGADPSDGVTLPLAAGAGNVAALDLLLAHGVDVNRPWATDGASPLYAILHWAKTAAGVRWLLEHGADPEPVFADNGETPLHAVAASWDTALAEELVNRGANITRPRADGRAPYAVAELNGNREVAEWLLAHGAPPVLSEVDRLVSACSRGESAAATAMLQTRPDLPSAIGPEHYAGFYRAAERNDTKALEVGPPPRPRVQGAAAHLGRGGLTHRAARQRSRGRGTAAARCWFSCGLAAGRRAVRRDYRNRQLVARLFRRRLRRTSVAILEWTGQERARTSASKKCSVAAPAAVRSASAASPMLRERRVECAPRRGTRWQ